MAAVHNPLAPTDALAKSLPLGPADSDSAAKPLHGTETLCLPDRALIDSDAPIVENGGKGWMTPEFAHSVGTQSTSIPPRLPLFSIAGYQHSGVSSQGGKMAACLHGEEATRYPRAGVTHTSTHDHTMRTVAGLQTSDSKVSSIGMPMAGVSIGGGNEQCANMAGVSSSMSSSVSSNSSGSGSSTSHSSPLLAVAMHQTHSSQLPAHILSSDDGADSNRDLTSGELCTGLHPTFCAPPPFVWTNQHGGDSGKSSVSDGGLESAGSSAACNSFAHYYGCGVPQQHQQQQQQQYPSMQPSRVVMGVEGSSGKESMAAAVPMWFVPCPQGWSGASFSQHETCEQQVRPPQQLWQQQQQQVVQNMPTPQEAHDQQKQQQALIWHMQQQHQLQQQQLQQLQQQVQQQQQRLDMQAVNGCSTSPTDGSSDAWRGLGTMGSHGKRSASVSECSSTLPPWNAADSLPLHMMVSITGSQDLRSSVQSVASDSSGSVSCAEHDGRVALAQSQQGGVKPSRKEMVATFVEENESESDVDVAASAVVEESVEPTRTGKRTRRSRRGRRTGRAAEGAEVAVTPTAPAVPVTPQGPKVAGTKGGANSNSTGSDRAWSKRWERLWELQRLREVVIGEHMLEETKTGATKVVERVMASVQPAQERMAPTTVMLRNIPNKYTQQLLLEHVSRHGFGVDYDFMYLPVDFTNRCNVGYAFFNFRSHARARDFIQVMDGIGLPLFNSHKICCAAFARVQGLKGNVEHYRNSPVMGVDDDSFKPALFCKGKRIPFPASDSPLPAVKPKKRRDDASV